MPLGPKLSRVLHASRPLTQVRHNFNLNVHTLQAQLLHANGRQQRLVIRAALAQVADHMAERFLVERLRVAPGLVHLLPALAASLLQGVLHVRERLVDLPAQVRADLFRDAVPATCGPSLVSSDQVRRGTSIARCPLTVAGAHLGRRFQSCLRFARPGCSGCLFVPVGHTLRSRSTGDETWRSRLFQTTACSFSLRCKMIQSSFSRTTALYTCRACGAIEHQDRRLMMPRSD